MYTLYMIYIYIYIHIYTYIYTHIHIYAYQKRETNPLYCPSARPAQDLEIEPRTWSERDVSAWLLAVLDWMACCPLKRLIPQG